MINRFQCVLIPYWHMTRKKVTIMILNFQPVPFAQRLLELALLAFQTHDNEGTGFAQAVGELRAHFRQSGDYLRGHLIELFASAFKAHQHVGAGFVWYIVHNTNANFWKVS